MIPAAVLVAAGLAHAAGKAAGSPAVAVRPVAAVRLVPAPLVRDPGRFGARGNLVVGYADPAAGADVLAELAPDGATVWEARLTPAGAVRLFSRRADGVTLVAAVGRDRARIRGFGPRGEAGPAFDLVPGRGRPPPEPTALQPLPGGETLVAVSGWAGRLTRRGTVAESFRDPNLRSARVLAGGTWLVALTDPPRFAKRRREVPALEELPLSELCHVWDAVRAEEPAPGRLRLYGCFCAPFPHPSGRGAERRTMEVIDLAASGAFAWAFGSPKAIRVNAFGAQTCATYTRQISDLPAGAHLVLDAHPHACRVDVMDAGGALVRTWATGPASTAADPGAFGERACQIVGAQLLE